MKPIYKLSFLILSTIFVALSSCSSKDNEDPFFSATYFGEFISLNSINNYVLDEISPKEAIEYMIRNNVPYETSMHTVIKNVPRNEKITSKYTVRINGDNAYLRSEEEVGEEGMKTQYNVTSYRFCVGIYKVTSEDVSPFERYIVVTHRQVNLEVWYNGTVTDNVITILDFPNDSGTYSIYDDGIELEPYYSITEQRAVSTYETIGDAYKNSQTTYTLRFDFVTYTLDIETGNFIQIFPDYKEIGKLDKI